MVLDLSNKDLFNKLEELLKRDYFISYVCYSTPNTDITFLKSDLKNCQINFDSINKILSISKQDSCILRLACDFIQDWWVETSEIENEFCFGFFGDKISSKKAGLKVKLMFKN